MIEQEEYIIPVEDLELGEVTEENIEEKIKEQEEMHGKINPLT